MKNQHPTKKGPGRRHGQGVTHGFVPRAHGADAQFSLHSSPVGNLRRAAKRLAGSFRQFRQRSWHWMQQAAAAKKV